MKNYPEPEPETAECKPAHARPQQPPGCVRVVVVYHVVVIVVIYIYLVDGDLAVVPETRRRYCTMHKRIPTNSLYQKNLANWGAGKSKN